ncbi:hypothetical protein HC891_13245, partial [Candidatus Gracilibacteria bacterium]|nr:hypothetical protein [Candidatus Gracilibacteria bacterium]
MRIQDSGFSIQKNAVTAPQRLNEVADASCGLLTPDSRILTNDKRQEDFLSFHIRQRIELARPARAEVLRGGGDPAVLGLRPASAAMAPAG